MWGQSVWKELEGGADEGKGGEGCSGPSWRGQVMRECSIAYSTWRGSLRRWRPNNVLNGGLMEELHILKFLY